MARTVEEWTESLARSLKQVPEEMRRAKAAELVRATQNLQKFSPRSGKRIRSGAARGYPALYRSIKVDRGDSAVYTEHPGAELLEHGGIVRPKRATFLLIPRRGWFRAGGEFVTIRISGNRRALVSKGKASRLLAILVPYVAIRARRWISKGTAETVRGSEERIADTVLRDEVKGG